MCMPLRPLGLIGTSGTGYIKRICDRIPPDARRFHSENYVISAVKNVRESAANKAFLARVGAVREW